MADLIDCRGLKCPQPVLKVAIKAHSAPSGSTLEVHADCESFPEDIQKWCSDSGHVLVSVVDRGAYHVATVQI
ncbi:MAG: sulfurtransferase TusA family protein [Planctomycetota bacterium]|jgi:tRNA 2-thiouridine synthesizing protein A